MKKYLFIAVLPLCLLSCNGDPLEPEVLCENYQVPSPNQITIGQTTGMLTRTDLGFIPSGIEVNQELEIKLACQSNPDFTLISQTGGGLGTGGYWENISLMPAANLKFHEYQNADTIYTFNDSSYVGSNPVYFSIATGEHCAKETITHTASLIGDKLIYHVAGDLISKTDYFVSEVEALRTGEYSLLPGTTDNGDTVNVAVYNYDHTCNNMAEEQAVYIAFSKEVDGQVKLGWVKLYHEYNVKTEVLEYAIQE